jgi:FkbM family methyltransferase
MGRALLRLYPLPFGKGWLANLLLKDSDIPANEVVSTRDGLKFRIHPDWIYKHIFLYGEYEPVNSRLFRRLVRPGDVCVDVGANFGYFTCLLADRGCTVYACEPLKDMCDRVLDSVALNGLQERVHLKNVALGENVGKVEIFTFRNLSVGHAATIDMGRDDALAHECQMMTLDALCEEERIENVTFVKMDVEGHELAVLKGGRQLLSRRNAPVVHFEVNENCLAARGVNPNQLLTLLESYGYHRFFSIGKYGGLRPVTRRISSRNGDYVAFTETNVGRLANP